VADPPEQVELATLRCIDWSQWMRLSWRLLTGTRSGSLT
jgi:hypothetical protein